MDSWVIQQLSFWFTVYETKPSAVVDKAIEIWLELVTPGRGAGESQWWMRGIRAVEQTAERTTREADIRRELRDWDREHPQIHHELIIRYVCGAAVSLIASSIYNSLTRRHSYRRGYH